MHGDVISTLFPPSPPVKWYDPRTWHWGFILLLLFLGVGFITTVGGVGYGLWLLAKHFGLV